MREITLRIPDEQFNFFRKLLQNLPWVQVEKTRKLSVRPAPLTAEQQEWVDDLKQSLLDAEAYQRGELELPTWQEVRAQQLAAQQQPAT